MCENSAIGIGVRYTRRACVHGLSTSGLNHICFLSSLNGREMAAFSSDMNLACNLTWDWRMRQAVARLFLSPWLKHMLADKGLATVDDTYTWRVFNNDWQLEGRSHAIWSISDYLHTLSIKMAHCITCVLCSSAVHYNRDDDSWQRVRGEDKTLPSQEYASSIEIEYD